MQQVTIIGLGLIGGSIGLGLRRWSAANGNVLSITGFDEDVNRQAEARKMGAIDQSEWSLVNAVKDADVVIVSTPVGAMKQVFTDIADHLKHGAIVTDTGSTKAQVLEDAKALPRTASFVGGHPMAGKSQSLEAADADLFKGATWVVCPGPHASDEAIRNVLGIVAALDSEAFFVDPVEHDAFVAGISHLPFVVAATLTTAVTSDPAWRDMRSLASTGFRDTTRLALGNPTMHRDIALSNRASISRWIDQYIAELSSFRSALNDEETAQSTLLAYFNAAQDARAAVEVPVDRAAEQILDGQDGLKKEGMSEQMGRMFLGGFGRKRRGKDTKQ
ncbi:MAG: prephenate dehydrogenase/arogenate dehydrogenase family protein [Thermomicrobiales bacterium]